MIKRFSTIFTWIPSCVAFIRRLGCPRSCQMLSFACLVVRADRLLRHLHSPPRDLSFPSRPDQLPQIAGPRKYSKRVKIELTKPFKAHPWKLHNFFSTIFYLTIVYIANILLWANDDDLEQGLRNGKKWISLILF